MPSTFANPKQRCSITAQLKKQNKLGTLRESSANKLKPTFEEEKISKAASMVVVSNPSTNFSTANKGDSQTNTQRVVTLNPC